ncbi:type II toxin-antitoxin system death-on-curing family toxin [Knoellia subterranea]|uniref:Death-on-curing protein n=1 Tax=Knoellia subterranea KCTC 19937 TaxID=1385521 RepID=A0A0A0JIC8_9MICO|nr:type II toxin-antitoxin system death-on-curing family toxin [Knoellia subterranea]KGN37145.1 death-on-curing protein [Knoellia subterranea KCTC 19937]
MELLDLDDLLRVAEVTLGDVSIRDIGLLESAVSRARATVFGDDAYPSLDLKVAALVQSIARNHALIDGNKRLALASAIATYGLNGRRLSLTNDEAYDLIIEVSTGAITAVPDIAERLRNEPRV